MFERWFEKMRQERVRRDPFYLVVVIEVLLVVIAMLFLGCHHFLLVRGSLAHVRTLAIPEAKAPASCGEEAKDLAEGVVRAIEEDGRFKVVEEEYADAILYIEVNH